jgi:RimJ/RimL family protein N-acetyltransferase
VITLTPVTLAGHDVRLEPLEPKHADALVAAASDGRLWEIAYTSVPEPARMAAMIDEVAARSARGEMLGWAVVDTTRGVVVGSTRYHDVVTAIGRVEIGYTWYAASAQRSHVNTAAKLLLMAHAFDTLGCGVVGLRTDILNRRSQAAIEALGARRDGVIRHHALRRDGSVRDTVMYSILAAEWPAVRAGLEARLARHRPG